MKIFTKKYIPPYIILLAPILIFLFIFLLYPILRILVWSFYKYIPFQMTDYSITFDNYIKFFSKTFYPEVLFTTIQISLIVSLITLVLGFPVAYFFVKSFPKAKKYGIFLIVTPIMIGLVVRSYGLIALFEEKGLVNNV